MSALNRFGFPAHVRWPGHRHVCSSASKLNPAKLIGSSWRPASLVVALLLFASTKLNPQQLSFSGTPVRKLDQLPAGATVPVRLDRSLRSGRTPSGTRIVATTTQRIPVGPHQYLRRGARLVGLVVVSDPGSQVHPATLSLRFTELENKDFSIPVRADGLAIANFMEVIDTTELATGGTDRGNPDPANWTTTQVGGDQIYRSSWIGTLYAGAKRPAGFADYHGVYSLPATQDGLPGALGAFSVGAKGMYGFDEGTTLSSQNGVLTINSASKPIILRAGSEILLVVLPPAPAQR